MISIDITLIKRISIVIGLLVLAIIGITIAMRGDSGDSVTKEGPAETNQAEISINEQNMKLSSDVFSNNETIPAQHTCDGEESSPPLMISDVPTGTKSLAVIMDDPDAPRGTWDHWVVFNISPDVTRIEAGTEPEGEHGQGTSGNLKYQGPCPPSGEHRYFFKLYALDAMLDLPEGVSKEEVEKAMAGHVIGQAELMGRYSRG